VAERKKYEFETVLKRSEGGMKFHYFDFPFDVHKEFGKKGSVRVWATVNGVKFDRALIPNGHGTHHVIMGKQLRKKAGIRLGDVLEVHVQLNPEPHELNIPEELEAVFELEPIVKERFETKLSPSTKRNICYWIDSAKREETRAKRAIEMMNRLLGDYFEMGGNRKIPLT